MFQVSNNIWNKSNNINTTWYSTKNSEFYFYYNLWDLAWVVLAFSFILRQILFQKWDKELNDKIYGEQWENMCKTIFSFFDFLLYVLAQILLEEPRPFFCYF